MNEAKYRQAEQRLWTDVGVQPNEKVVTLASSGTDVRVQIIGSGEPVLFIHGGPNSGSTWAPIVGAFDGYQCLLVDRPGTGLSAPYADLEDVHDFVRHSDRFVSDIADALGFERLHIVASSLGGYIAIRSAANAPDRFGRMVQMACPAMAPGMLLPKFMTMMSSTLFRRVTGVLPPSRKVSNDIMRQIGHGKSIDAGRIPDTFTDWYLDLQRYTDTMRNDGDLIGMAVSRKTGIDPSLTLTDATLGAVEAPTLFLWGEDDGFGGADVAERTTDPMPNVTLEMIPDAGHLPWLDFPAEIGARTRAFIDG
ncbi:MAG: alpha/beta hydrolase [Acidimicrobiia bacterium]|nr:alpha/beta hydrolase [Acidimicrobiia bacterium]